MRVANWYKWTRFKKRLATTLFLVGMLMGLSIENGSIAYGYWGIFFGILGVSILTTIRDNEW